MMFKVESAEILAVRHPGIFRKPMASRAVSWGSAAAALALFIYGCWYVGFSLDNMITGVSRLSWFVVLMFPPDPGTHFWIYLHALGETLSIAVLGTLLGAFLVAPISLFAARNIVPFSLIRFPVRRFLDSVRGVDTLIWALVWINVVGLGPFAGVLAIASSDFGEFGKLFSEAIETADQKQVEGVRAAGGSRLHEVRFGLVPQVLPVIASQILYYIESNTRSATIIGIVGAGGIGLQLAEQIRVLEWQNVSFLILMILAAVMAIDFISNRLRFAIIGKVAVSH
jgi:phosphonate transport system permease protein